MAKYLEIVVKNTPFPNLQYHTCLSIRGARGGEER